MQCIASAAACLDSLYSKFKKCVLLTKELRVGPGMACIVHSNNEDTWEWLKSGFTDNGTLPILFLRVIQ
jgi:hypothetical protein